MVKGCAPKIAKMTLFVLNFAVWCCSVAILSLGIWMSVRSSKFESLFSEDNVSTVAYMMICIGACLFIVGFSGCCGAKRESSFWLNIYFILMLALVLVEVVAGIMAFVYSSQLEEFMRIGMNETIAESYGYATSATTAVDTVQENFNCCGANSFSDYTYSKYMADIKRAVPTSCCKSNDVCGLGTPGNPVSSVNIWATGCVSASIETIESNVVALGAVCFALLAVEILSMIFARCVTKSIHKQRTKTVKVKSKPASSKKGTSSKSSKKETQSAPSPNQTPYQPPPPYYGQPPAVAQPYYAPPTTHTEPEVLPIAVGQNPEVQNKYSDVNVMVDGVGTDNNGPQERDNGGYF